MKRCPSCDQEMDDEAAREGFCDKCGQEFDTADFSTVEGFYDED